MFSWCGKHLLVFRIEILNSLLILLIIIRIKTNISICNKLLIRLSVAYYGDLIIKNSIQSYCEIFI